MNTLTTEHPALAAFRPCATLTILERVKPLYDEMNLAHGAHQTNLRLLVWEAGKVARHLDSSHPLRDTLKRIAATAMRWLPFTWEALVAQILAERHRQQELLATGKFPFSCSTTTVDSLFKLPVLMEEIGEVGNAILEGETANLSRELLQVATVCVGWLEALEAHKR